MPGPGRKFPPREIVAGPFRYSSVSEAARAHGISRQLFGRRMAKGLTPAQALGIEPPPDWFVPGKGQLAKALGQRRIKREAETGLRICSNCKKEKPLLEFHNYQQSNLNGPGRCKECNARLWIRYRYKIEADQFFEMVKQQQGRCAVCRCDLELSTESARRRSLAAIDHCHATGVVRGLLCQPCNTGIGLLGDSPERLRLASRYLDDFQSKQQSAALAQQSNTFDAETN